MLKMRMVYVNEYNAMIAKVKRDELPKLDPKLHNGWRLAAQEKITSPKEVKDLASDARKLLGQTDSRSSRDAMGSVSQARPIRGAGPVVATHEARQIVASYSGCTTAESPD